jgi:hypothetical protein
MQLKKLMNKVFKELKSQLKILMIHQPPPICKNYKYEPELDNDI